MNTELDLPSLNGDDKKKKRLASITGAAQTGGRLSFLLSMFGKARLLLGLGVMVLANQVMLNSRNAALKHKTSAETAAAHTSEALPSDLVVQKMRQSSNLDNMALVSSKNRSGMRFGDQEAPTDQSANQNANAGNVKAAAPQAAAAQKPAQNPDMAKMLAGLTGKGAGAPGGFGSGGFGGNNASGAGAFGAGGFGGGAGGGGNGASNPFGNSIKPGSNGFAPGGFNGAAGARGVSSGMARAQSVGAGSAARGMGAGKLNAMGQLRAAASLSHNAKGMSNYAAANTSAGAAFNGGTAGGGIGGSGIAGGGTGVNGAGLSSLQTGALGGSGTGGGGGGGVATPTLATPTAQQPDQSCSGGNPTMSQGDFVAAGGDPNQYPQMVKDCNNQNNMKNDMWWLMGAGAALLALQLLGCASKNPFGGEVAWVAAMAAYVVITAICVKIIVDSIQTMIQSPSLMMSAIMMLAGAGMCAFSAIQALMGAYAAGYTPPSEPAPPPAGGANLGVLSSQPDSPYSLGANTDLSSTDLSATSDPVSTPDPGSDAGEPPNGQGADVNHGGLPQTQTTGTSLNDDGTLATKDVTQTYPDGTQVNAHYDFNEGTLSTTNPDGTPFTGNPNGASSGTFDTGGSNNNLAQNLKWNNPPTPTPASAPVSTLPQSSPYNLGVNTDLNAPAATVEPPSQPFDWGAAAMIGGGSALGALGGATAHVGGASAPAAAGGAAPAGGAGGGGGGGGGSTPASAPAEGAGGLSTSGPTIGQAGSGTGGQSQG